MNTLAQSSIIISIVLSVVFGLFFVLTFGVPKRFSDFLFGVSLVALPWLFMYQLNHGVV